MFTFATMKRTISILLLSVLLVTALEPTLAFHFCGGSFHSVGIGGELRTCCGGEMDAEPAGAPSLTLSEHHEPCCSGYAVEISTDTYQIPSVHPTAPAALRMDTLFVPCLPYSVADNYALSASCLRTTFPPGGLPRHTVDRLSLNCILRI
jgi:hypothetical protein